MTAPPTDPLRIRYRMTFLLLLLSRQRSILWLPVFLTVLSFAVFALLDVLSGDMRTTSPAAYLSYTLPRVIGSSLTGTVVGTAAFLAALLLYYWKLTPAQRDVTAEFHPEGLSLIDGQGSASLLAWPAIRRIAEARRVLRIEFTAGNACAMPLAAFTPADLNALWPLLAQAGVKTKRR